MHQFAPKFRKDGIRRVSELKNVNEGELTKWGVTALTDRKRIMGMITGEETAKTFFALQTRAQARSIIAQFLPPSHGDSGSTQQVNNTQEMEEILDIIGEEQITGYQLRDIFDENKNLNIVKKKLAHKLSQNTLFQRGLLKEPSITEEEENEKKRKDVPQVSIESILKGLGLNESVPKVKEHEIDDLEIFYGIEDDKLIELLEIKTEGKKLRFKEKIKEVKEKHEKAKAKKEAAEEVSEMVSEKFELLRKKSNISF